MPNNAAMLLTKRKAEGRTALSIKTAPNGIVVVPEMGITLPP
jgi:hypothetical protein